ncbi:uncharacterized protein [Littorina saxatilis]|uniref:uncharacterized protein isoform X2 n=1 Tax=Littorina saxatilis TaxID=31220 RepID=UPI0038B5ABD7
MSMIAGRMTCFRLLAIFGLLLTCLAELDFDGDCIDANSANCKTGYVCDALDKCRIAQAGDCTSNEDKCASGASCINNTCVCTSGLSNVNDSESICIPVTKKVGGSCSSGDGASACDDSNAECTSSSCSCKTGYTAVPATLTCQSKSMAPKTTLSSLLLFLGLLLTSRLA